MASSSKSTDELIKIVREGCLKRGVGGIQEIARAFRLFDNEKKGDSNKDKSEERSLNKDEFVEGLQDYQIDLTEQEMWQLFDKFDTDKNGTLNYEEFLKLLRPSMNEKRMKIINEAFTKLDNTGDGVITVEDLKGKYDISQHPKFKNGEWTEERCLVEFLHCFEDGNPDGKVTKEEFLNYYAGVSDSIDDDEYFGQMMKQAWNIED